MAHEKGFDGLLIIVSGRTGRKGRLSSIWMVPSARPIVIRKVSQDWQKQNTVVFVLIEMITQRNEAIIVHSRRFLYNQNTERDKPCFQNLYMANLG